MRSYELLTWLTLSVSGTVEACWDQPRAMAARVGNLESRNVSAATGKSMPRSSQAGLREHVEHEPTMGGTEDVIQLSPHRCLSVSHVCSVALVPGPLDLSHRTISGPPVIQDDHWAANSVTKEGSSPSKHLSTVAEIVRKLIQAGRNCHVALQAARSPDDLTKSTT
ncbi:hypothetical protein GCM10009765_22780 [Fodinicola feengrottensis]|uniref:Uncharacterized protein n=1 Tax=Fodinicola feengrottensis TaxID=435914 RepID=A0ABN2GKW7_9ACTN